MKGIRIYLQMRGIALTTDQTAGVVEEGIAEAEEIAEVAGIPETGTEAREDSERKHMILSASILSADFGNLQRDIELLNNTQNVIDEPEKHQP